MVYESRMSKIQTEAGLERLLQRVAACRMCAQSLPLAPRPVVRIAASAKLLIIGQAPGTRAHETGLPWNDDSGDRLRQWMGFSRERFYDEKRIAIMPMGFCYPGRAPGGGDLPPRSECAPAWHQALRAYLPAIELTLLVGGYAQRYYLGQEAAGTMTETVKDFRRFLPIGMFPLPHPSWRTTAWRRRNLWFAADVTPALRCALHALFNVDNM